MKKLWTALLSIAIVAAAGMCTMAGTFDGYWDFEQADGTYAYGFPRILVVMDKTWYQNTRVVLGEDGSTASFYHKGSYNAYAEEGMTGGLLFTIGASVNTDFQDLPGFVYLGFDEEEAMNYYAALPTDYQAFMEDEAIRNEYDELWSGVEDVLASAVIKGSQKFRELYGSEDDQAVESEPQAEEEAATEESFSPYDYITGETGNGKYLVYTFPDVCLLVPAGWKGRYVIDTDEYGVNFYQKASHDRYLDENVTEHGGFLFRLSASEDESFRDLPDYRDIGFSENAGLYFYLKLPTDVRFYNDPEIREEYGEMFGEIDLIADMAQIRKSMHFYTDGIESTDPGMS